MLIKMFGIYDSKLEAFHTPLFYPTLSVAIRALSDYLSSHPDSTLAKHPADYRLFTLGEFDDVNGVPTAYASKTAVCYLNELTAVHIPSPEVSVS